MPNLKREQQKALNLVQQGTLNPRPQDVTAELFQAGDFFDPRDLAQVKYEMLRRVQVDKSSVSQSAKSFGFSRPSYYQAHFAFAEGGLAGLLPQKRGPRRAHKLNSEVMEFLERSRADQPSLASPELAGMIRERFGLVVHPRSIERALLRQQKNRAKHSRHRVTVAAAGRRKSNFAVRGLAIRGVERNRTRARTDAVLAAGHELLDRSRVELHLAGTSRPNRQASLRHSTISQRDHAHSSGHGFQPMPRREQWHLTRRRR